MLLVCAMYDSKTKSYGTPVFNVAKGQALRAFSDACEDPRCPFRKHPEDYSLFQLGEYDPATGTLIPMKPRPELLVTVSQVLRTLEQKKEVKEPSLPLETPDLSQAKRPHLNEVKGRVEKQ